MTSSEDLVADLLAAHALGRLPPPLATIVAAHVEMSPAAARAFAGFEALAGRALAEATPVAMENRDRRLDTILATARDDAPLPARAPREGLPKPLADLVAAAPKRWRFAWFGVKRRPIGRFGTYTVEMIRVRGRRAIPDHGHVGLEATLVIEGGFTDAGIAYGPGDLAVADAETVHRPIADPEGCICIAVTEGMRPTFLERFRFRRG